MGYPTYPLEPHHWVNNPHVLPRFSPSKGWCVDLCRLQLGGPFPAVITLTVNVVDCGIRLLELRLIQLPGSIHKMGHGERGVGLRLVDYGYDSNHTAS